MTARRLPKILGAYVISVMEATQIGQQGTHEGLLASGGAYARLYRVQFASAVIGGVE